jgi:hypothetical protein
MEQGDEMPPLDYGYLLWVRTYTDAELRSKSLHSTIEEARTAATKYFSNRAELQITRTGDGAKHAWMFNYITQEWETKRSKVPAPSLHG